jgi:hypothetical protein
MRTVGLRADTDGRTLGLLPCATVRGGESGAGVTSGEFRRSQWPFERPGTAGRSAGWGGRIKASVTVLEFVSQHVDLKPTASRAIGLCPFHQDHRPSFGVNAEGNYWNCWGGCGGGSVVDFWMKWPGCDLTTAITELVLLWHRAWDGSYGRAEPNSEHVV